MKKILILSVVILQIINWNNTYSQDELKKWELDGYVSNMSSYIKADMPVFNIEYLDNIIHNRLNFHWYPTNAITSSIQIRNQLFVGDQIRNDINGELKKAKKEDFLAFNSIEDSMILLNSMVDRLWVKLSLNKFDFTVGRQRINWGQTFAFNPNDIFNAYSFFDFDYPERPGSDAFRIQFYPNYTSTIDLAIKADGDSSFTAGALVRFSKWNYDIQLLSGIYNTDEVVFGGGWAGNIKDISFSGEATYLHPRENFGDTSGLFFSSINLNYTFSNSLTFMIEGYYNQFAAKSNLNFITLLAAEQDLKTLTFSEYSVMGQASYPFNPLINSSITVMYYPDIKGFNIYPSFDFSISDNATFSIIGMAFLGEFDYSGTIGKRNDEMFLGFLRFKYNF